MIENVLSTIKIVSSTIEIVWSILEIVWSTVDIVYLFTLSSPHPARASDSIARAISPLFVPAGQEKDMS